MRRIGVAAIAAAAFGLASVPSALAFGGDQLNASQCGHAKLAVNVTQKIINDADSGTLGNVWAFDAYNRHIQLWQTGPNTFCAIVDYHGQFTTVAGPSPQAATDTGGTVSAGVEGTFEGGYRALITGTLNPSPSYKTRGDLGLFNYNCDMSFNCPGYVDWTQVYFTGGPSSFNEVWWGWQYHGAKHGTWINSSDGNSGDITG